MVTLRWFYGIFVKMITFYYFPWMAQDCFTQCYPCPIPFLCAWTDFRQLRLAKKLSKPVSLLLKCVMLTILKN